MATVITYQTSRGDTIDLTPSQVELLESHRRWPRASSGEEYHTVSHGRHDGHPTWTDDELRDECGISDD